MGTLKITWLGHASIRVEGNGKAFYFDPWIRDNPACTLKIEEIMSAPGHFGRRFWSVPAGHSGACRPPIPAQASHPPEQRLTLDSPCRGVSCLEPTPGGTLWPLSDYPCVRRARSSA